MGLEPLIFGKFISTYADDWKKAKTQFTALTGKAKPDAGKKILKLFKNHATGLEKLLTEATYAVDHKTSIKDARKAIGALKAKALEYHKVLKKEIESSGEDELLGAAHAMLAKKLKALVAKSEAGLAQKEAELASESKADDAAEKQALAAKAKVRETVASASAYLKEILALAAKGPDDLVSQANKLMYSAYDNVRAGLATATNARARGVDIADPAGLANRITPFSDRKLFDDGADSGAIKGEVVKFAAVLKDIKAAYK